MYRFPPQIGWMIVPYLFKQRCSCCCHSMLQYDKAAKSCRVSSIDMHSRHKFAYLLVDQYELDYGLHPFPPQRHLLDHGSTAIDDANSWQTECLENASYILSAFGQYL